MSTWAGVLPSIKDPVAPASDRGPPPSPLVPLPCENSAAPTKGSQVERGPGPLNSQEEGRDFYWTPTGPVLGRSLTLLTPNLRGGCSHVHFYGPMNTLREMSWEQTPHQGSPLDHQPLLSWNGVRECSTESQNIRAGGAPEGIFFYPLPIAQLQQWRPRWVTEPGRVPRRSPTHLRPSPSAGWM